MVNLDVITAALQLLGVIPEGQEATAEQADLGLKVLQDMLDEWESEGVYLNHSPDMTLLEDFAAPASATTAVKANLATTLAPYYERLPNAVVVAMAQAGWSRLVRDAVSGQMKEADMSHLPGAASTWDFEAG
jgi:hypothetical protein